MFADYQILRKAIDESDSKYQDLMRISYLFGVRVSELLPDKKGGEALERRRARSIKVIRKIVHSNINEKDYEG